MDAIRTILFDGASLQIGQFEARPVSDACGDVQWQDSNVVVLPVSGVFSKHDAPGRHVIGTPSHAVFVAADTPYRISFPGAIGDRALTLRFGQHLAADQPDSGGEVMASHGLLPPGAIMLRNLLGHASKVQRRTSSRPRRLVLTSLIFHSGRCAQPA